MCTMTCDLSVVVSMSTIKSGAILSLISHMRALIGTESCKTSRFSELPWREERGYGGGGVGQSTGSIARS